jgi:hypothetical protein
LWYVILRKAQLVAREPSTQIAAHVPGQRQGKCACCAIRIVKERPKAPFFNAGSGNKWRDEALGRARAFAVRSRGLET